MIEIIQQLTELQFLADAWNQLADSFQTPLLRHEWFLACALAFCPPDQLAVVVARFRGTITAIAPLVVRGNNGRERLELLGASFLFEPSGLIYKDEESLQELLGALLHMQGPTVLSRLRPESSEARSLNDFCGRRAFLSVREGPGSPWIAINQSWEEFEGQMSSRRRSGLRRARRRAEEFGRLQFEILSPNPSDVDRLLQDIFQVEAMGWKGRNGCAIVSQDGIRSFFSLYARAAARLGMLRLCFLRIAGRPIAVQLAIEYANRFWVLKIGYDEAWARCSPGILLMHETVRYAFERGLQSYEFLGVDEPWIRMWTEQVHPYVSFRIYPFSWRAMLRLGMDASRFVMGKVLKSARGITFL